MGMWAIETKLQELVDLMTSLGYAPIPAPQTPMVDASIASATGASQEVVPANPDRRELFLFNLSNKSWWINPTGGTAAANVQGNVLLAAGGNMVLETTSAVTAIGTSGKALTALER